MFSTNASCGPLITFSICGLSIFLCLNPFASISKAIFNVSTNKTQLPELISEIILLNSICLDRLLLGIRLV